MIIEEAFFIGLSEKGELLRKKLEKSEKLVGLLDVVYAILKTIKEGEVGFASETRDFGDVSRQIAKYMKKRYNVPESITSSLMTILGPDWFVWELRRSEDGMHFGEVVESYRVDWQMNL